jgi:hypothetical protein
MYLASIMVFNLLPEDYNDKRIEEIEQVINGAISRASWLSEKVEANDKNVIFSFPPDPTVKTASIPLLVDITLLSIPEKWKKDFAVGGISYEVRDWLKNHFESRKNIVVITRWPHGLIGYCSEPY